MVRDMTDFQYQKKLDEIYKSGYFETTYDVLKNGLIRIIGSILCAVLWVIYWSWVDHWYSKLLAAFIGLILLLGFAFTILFSLYQFFREVLNVLLWGISSAFNFKLQPYCGYYTRKSNETQKAIDDLKSRKEESDRKYNEFLSSLSERERQVFEWGSQDGYIEGEEKGYLEGERIGKKKGYDEGFSDGLDSGYQKGKKAGYKKGYSSGKRSGESSGYKSGLHDGRIGF
ncbi:hypothetical protein [Veillonella caviae]|uniref:hypothetical protein n=1 Tax=Veillonella caviae TaxID=248316 RepID=UPI0023534F41|nr:hypothetical protein [Veillonella caviae]